MSFPGYRDYRRREFCNAVMCPVQKKLNRMEKGSEEYEKAREECRENCRHTTREFHYWLMDNGFLIVKREGGGG